MQFFVFFLGLCAVLCGQISCEEPDDENVASSSNVLVLTNDNYEDTINQYPLLLVEFYAPWCGHCKALEPEYEAAAKELLQHTPPIPLAKVDSTEQEALSNRMGINGYPTLFVYHDGKSYEYEGPRRAKGIVEYMKQEAAPDWLPPENHVLVLTTDNFTDTVQESALILVEFYAPWCGHCKKLAPEYAKAAKDLRLKHDIPVAKVDATEETSIAEQFGVTGYPTMMLFRKGKDYEYKGPRERKGIVDYMREQSVPASSLLTNRKDFDLHLGKSLSPIVLAFVPDEMDPWFTAYIELANQGRGTPLQFWHSTSEHAQNYGAQTKQLVILRPPRFQSDFEPAISLYDELVIGANMSTALSDVMSLATPLVALRSKDTAEWTTSNPKLVAYLELDTSQQGREAFKYWRSRLLPVARHHSDRLSVAMSDETEYLEELESLGLGDWGEDVAMVIWVGPKEKYVMREEFEEDALKQFVQDFFAGELKAHIRSQRKTRQQGPVTVVVGDTFEQIVMDTSKHVFVEFYAPWCGHCKALEPKFKKLAKKLKNAKDLVIAKFDATANDVPSQFEFKGFPTFFFVPAGGVDVEVYEGGREVSDMVEYLTQKMAAPHEEL